MSYQKADTTKFRYSLIFTFLLQTVESSFIS